MSLVPGRRWLVFAFVCLSVTIGSAEQAAAQTLTVRWDPSPDPAVAGYIVYAGTQSREYTASFNVGKETSFTYGVVPDRQYFFAVALYDAEMTVGRVSGEVVGAARTVTSLSDLGDQSATVGSPTELQLPGMGSAGGAVTFGIAGLPPGLSLNSSTGRVSGTPTTAGGYQVTASASDGVSTATQTFTWTIVSGPIDRYSAGYHDHAAGDFGSNPGGGPLCCHWRRGRRRQQDRFGDMDEQPRRQRRRHRHRRLAGGGRAARGPQRHHHCRDRSIWQSRGGDRVDSSSAIGTQAAQD